MSQGHQHGRDPHTHGYWPIFAFRHLGRRLASGLATDLALVLRRVFKGGAIAWFLVVRRSHQIEKWAYSRATRSPLVEVTLGELDAGVSADTSDSVSRGHDGGTSIPGALAASAEGGTFLARRSAPVLAKADHSGGAEAFSESRGPQDVRRPVQQQRKLQRITRAQDLIHGQLAARDAAEIAAAT